MAIKAYSYVRFSSSIQEFGDSIRRQTLKRDEFIKNSGLDLSLDTSLDMTDKGLSAFDGSNVEKGALGAFLKAIEIGLVEKGSYLLVENLDRLSRESLEKSISLFLDILREGIYIVTLSDGKIIEPGNLSLTDMLPVMVELERAHQESKRKSILIKSAWDKKRENIDKVKLTKWSPKWLNLSEDRTQFVLIEDRVKVIKKMFEWAKNGLGTHLIIKKLEEEGIEPWDMGTIKREKRIAKKWHTGIIQRIFTDRTVLGEYRLRRKNKDEGYDVIENYYPQIIDNELFAQVENVRQKRKVNGGGRKGSGLSNLFSKLAYCGYSVSNNLIEYQCAGSNEVMAFVNKGSNSKYNYLQCSRLKSGNTGCEKCSKMWRYDLFEKSFLMHVKEIDISTIFGKKNDLEMEIERIENEILVQKSKKNEYKKRLDQIKDKLRNLDEIPDVFVSVSLELESDIKNANNLITELNSKLFVKKSEFEKSDKNFIELNSMIELMDGLEGNNLFELRIKLAELLKKAIKKILLFPNGVVRSESYYNEVEKELGEEAVKLLLKNEKNLKNKVYQFYMVEFISGEYRVIATDYRNSSFIDLSVKFKNNEIIDFFKSFNGELLDFNTR